MLIPIERLVDTAATEASTPAAPLIPQNHGVGFWSTRETSLIPVGKPNPISLLVLRFVIWHPLPAPDGADESFSQCT